MPQPETLSAAASPYAGKKVLVVGLARTGVALSRFLAGAGAQVTITDQASAADLEPARQELAGLGIAEALGVPEPAWQGFDLITLSPGVPPELPWLEAARGAGLPVVGELEVASAFIHKPLMAISGTNGKTTTTTLVGELLAASGLDPLVGGNIGTPVLDLLARQDQAQWLVLEVSSFQLDTAPSFHAQAAALLNITPDHLDRYPDLTAYAASKAGLFRNQLDRDLRVLNADDPAVAALGQGRGRKYYFSLLRRQTLGAWLSGDAILVRLDDGREARFPLADIRLKEPHNLENVMAALLLALEAGADAGACREVLAGFQGLPHRIQWVANINGVAFYDDSKGTNVGAVAKSLANFTQPVILIAGGRDKASDFSLLNPIIQAHVKALVLLGETKDHLAQVWRGLAPVHLAGDMADAVQRAWESAAPGDVVLLSPACASFDMFRDYAHRGDTFQLLVRRLHHENQTSGPDRRGAL
jgi:UDP-N-acetylmuramoylalanine--D-glutamate ligase